MTNSKTHCVGTAKPLATFKESYRHFYFALRSFPILKKSLSQGLISAPLKERIMLAVTEVNGCALCSYGHTTFALEAGLSQTEIDQLLNGEMGSIPPQDRIAVLFAQHVADGRGRVSKKAWENLIATQGKEQSLGILAATHVIMAGNTYGIPFGSFLARITKKDRYEKDPRSSIGYELRTLFSMLLFLPCACIHACFAAVFAFPVADFV
ncbi:MAG: carboxymuconolactone decarboxylase family protein [Clostridiales bacterium]|nr:carboxymuconolactone decarboxylase family protein [Clostridiales bacterium]